MSQVIQCDQCASIGQMGYVDWLEVFTRTYYMGRRRGSEEQMASGHQHFCSASCLMRWSEERAAQAAPETA